MDVCVSNFIFSKPRDCWQSNNAAAKTNFTWSQESLHCIILSNSSTLSKNWTKHLLQKTKNLLFVNFRFFKWYAKISCKNETQKHVLSRPILDNRSFCALYLRGRFILTGMILSFFLPKKDFFGERRSSFIPIIIILLKIPKRTPPPFLVW